MPLNPYSGKQLRGRESLGVNSQNSVPFFSCPPLPGTLQHDTPSTCKAERPSHPKSDAFS